MNLLKTNFFSRICILRNGGSSKYHTDFGVYVVNESKNSGDIIFISRKNQSRDSPKQMPK